MRTLDDVDVNGRTVVVRVDFNVPIDNGGGSGPPTITDDARIRGALPTLRELRGGNPARLVLLAHLGRPKDREPEFSLKPVAARLAELLGVDVPVIDEPDPALIGRAGADSEVVMVENVRYFAGETKDDEALARRYAALGDVYVNDAFGAAHRAHASTHGVAKLLPSAAGRLLQREVQTLTGILANPQRPLVAIVGGAKVTDKIGVLDAFVELADAIVIGGAMMFPFAAAQGHEVGDSLCEAEGIEPARRVLADGEGKVHLPVDLVAGRAFSADTETQLIDGVDVPAGWMGLDIGPKTAQSYADIVVGAGTVFWNGPMGAFELAPFAAGTEAVARAVVACTGTTVVGGGDSAAALKQFGMEDGVTHLSTGGGASLELIEGKALPGVEVLS